MQRFKHYFSENLSALDFHGKKIGNRKEDRYIFI